MNLNMLKCKIHRATVTGADLNYEGSISIDSLLCDMAGLQKFEKVEVYNCDNGERFATYVIYGSAGEICLNGAAARKVHRGDRIIICSYASMSQEETRDYRPKLVFVGEHNEPKKDGHVI